MTCSRVVFVVALAGAINVATVVGAQTSLSLDAAVSRALERYPSVRAASAEVAAADADVAVTRGAYLPTADLLWQANRATRNNIAGLLLPQAVVSSITGPVTPARGQSAWNTAVGILFAWEPVDFGARAAAVRAAEFSRDAARADASLTRLEVSAATAAAYLQIVTADELVRAAHAGVERARVLFEVVDARVRGGLRPGAESARARAEMAAAESAEARAQQAAAVARAELARWIGGSPDQIAIAGAPYLQLPAALPMPAQEPHPAVVAQVARVDSAKASATELARSYAPRVFLEGTASSRATGVRSDGTFDGSTGFDAAASNWALGVNVTFPILDLPMQRSRRAAGLARTQLAEARQAQTLQDLESERRKAQAALDMARRIAALTPVQREAARAAEEQARARFESGLGTIADVADTTRLLTDAEAAHALAVLDVWRAELALAAATGDVTPMFRRP